MYAFLAGETQPRLLACFIRLYIVCVFVCSTTFRSHRVYRFLIHADQVNTLCVRASVCVYIIPESISKVSLDSVSRGLWTGLRAGGYLTFFSHAL